MPENLKSAENPSFLGKLLSLKKPWPISFGILAAIAWVVAAINYAGMKAQDEPQVSQHLAVVLLAMPLAQGCVLLFLAFREATGTSEKDGLLNVLSIFMCVSTVIYSFGWYLYSRESLFESVWVGFVLAAIFFTALALLLVGRKRQLFPEIRQHTFLLALYFLGMFLSISHCLTFALALHNKQQEAQGRYGLCENPLPLALPVLAEQPVVEPVLLQPPVVKPALLQPPTIPGEPETPNILFLSGSAQIYADSRKAREQCPENPDKAVILANGNEKMFAAIGKKLGEYGPNPRLRVTLVGHTDEKEFKKPVSGSNYELATARANAVLLHLSKALQSRPISEWIIVPTAYGNRIFLEKPLTAVPGDPWGPERAVEVYVEALEPQYQPGGGTRAPSEGQATNPSSKPPGSGEDGAKDLNSSCAHMNLNDYIYFTIYTITTTGYGDIRPVSGQAKFIVSIANLIEVIFLVIFFNALLGSSKEPGDPVSIDSSDCSKGLAKEGLDSRIGKLEKGLEGLDAAVKYLSGPRPKKDPPQGSGSMTP